MFVDDVELQKALAVARNFYWEDLKRALEIKTLGI